MKKGKLWAILACMAVLAGAVSFGNLPSVRAEEAPTPVGTMKQTVDYMYETLTLHNRGPNGSGDEAALLYTLDTAVTELGDALVLRYAQPSGQRVVRITVVCEDENGSLHWCVGTNNHVVFYSEQGGQYVKELDVKFSYYPTIRADAPAAGKGNILIPWSVFNSKPASIKRIGIACRDNFSNNYFGWAGFDVVTFKTGASISTSGVLSGADDLNGLLGESTALCDLSVYDSAQKLSQDLENGKLVKVAYDAAFANKHDEYGWDTISIYDRNRAATVSDVTLNDDIVGGLQSSVDPAIKQIEQSTRDTFPLLQLINLETPVDKKSGLAFKIGDPYGASSYRIYLQDSDGDVFLANGNATLPYMSDRGYENVWKLDGRSRLISSKKDSGTLYLPYTYFAKSTHTEAQTTGFKAPEGETDGILTDIQSLYIAQMADKNANTRMRAVIKSIYTVDADTASFATKLFDAAELTATFEPENTESDVNFAVPKNGKTVKPVSAKPASLDDYLLSTATSVDFYERAAFDLKTVGDVKILENFDVKDDDGLGYTYTADEKDSVIDSYPAGFSEQKSRLKYYKSADYAYGNAAAWKIADMSEYDSSAINNNASFFIQDNGLVEDWHDLHGAKGLTLYVENPSDKFIDFGIGIDVVDSKASEAAGKEIWERWTIVTQGKPLYYYNTETGEEFGLYSGGAALVYIPPRFTGWVRIPFTSMAVPAWSVTSNGADGAWNVDDPLFRVRFNCDFMRHAGKTFVFDNIGLYYNDFGVKSSVKTNEPTMAERLRTGTVTPPTEEE